MKKLRQQGFTLIEVLIAMTLLSIMVVLLFSSLRIAAESWNAGEAKVAEVNKKAVVYQFFKRHLSSIRPLPMLNSDQMVTPENQQAFQGLPQRLRFAAALPVASARKGLQLFTIALDSSDHRNLMVDLVPYRLTDSDKQQERERPEVLLEGVEDMKFSYFGKTEDVADMRWRDEWTAADRLPSLIKVSIRLDNGSYWPEMVFAPKIARALNVDVVDNTDSNNDTDADVR